MTWISFGYKLVVLALSTYAVWLLLGIYVVPEQKRQQLLKEVYDNYQTFSNSYNSPSSSSSSSESPSLLNATDPHSYCHFYRQYGKRRMFKRLTDVDDYEQHELLSWANGPFGDGIDATIGSWKGDGLILMVSTFTLRRTIHQLKALKEFGCPLTIKVYYTYDGALSKEELKLLKDETGHVAIDLSDLLPAQIRREVTTDYAKPFAAFFSPFQRIIIADHEVVFVTDPSPFLKDDLGRKGAIFALDRTLFGGNFELVKLTMDLLPQPFSENVGNGYFMQQKSSYQQDSSFIAMDKRATWLGIIATGNLVLPALRKTLRRRFEGEKEAWWLGFEQAKIPFAWEQIPPVSIGYLTSIREDTARVCGGHALHYRDNGKPLWISGGYDRNNGPGGSPQADNFANMIDREAAGQWYAQLCQDGKALGVEEIQSALSWLKSSYSSDYQWKYFEEAVEPVR